MIGGPVIDRTTEGQIEIAVEERSVPSDADLVAAHEVRQRRRIEGAKVRLHLLGLDDVAMEVVKFLLRVQLGDRDRRERA